MKITVKNVIKTMYWIKIINAHVHKIAQNAFHKIFAQNALKTIHLMKIINTAS